MELAPRSGQAFVVGKQRIASANEARRGKRVPIRSRFFNINSVLPCDKGHAANKKRNAANKK